MDCGIIYATDAKAAGLEIVDSAGEEMCGHVIYPASILEASTHRDEAMDFLSYLRSEAGRAQAPLAVRYISGNATAAAANTADHHVIVSRT